ncbi:MAG TPA: hydroxymethylbilane synthase [Candidatus Baltobacteraceae bacterium]|jgi:hydroxymethylbilane synthase|nr:hydroxymethylbilane synthase [Candidatus Baltobacteraceae bacterium]
MKNEADVVAAAAQTLERMRVYVSVSVPAQHRARTFSELAKLPLEELASMNPVEAEHAVERVASAIPAREDSALPQESGAAVVCASRASALALTQARLVASRLAQKGVATTILHVTTTGDRVQDRSFAAIGSQSLFVKELELALRDGRAQYAVHSCKDLPSTIPPDMRIAAITHREDPRDAFCSERHASFASLPPHARVGTSSMRRRAQLAAMRPDLDYVDIRGNVDTRLRKMRDGEFDAIVLACAGLHRLGISAKHTVPFDVTQMVPAAGQGALAIETAADSLVAPVLREAVNDERAEQAILCERAALRALRGGCQAPVGIHARFEGGALVVTGVVASEDGTTVLREEASAAHTADPESVGLTLANALLARGAERLLAAPN